MILHAAWQPSVRVFRAPSQQETTWERDRMNASSIRTPFVLWGSLDWPRRQGTMHCKMRMMMKRSANWSAQGSAMIFLPALPLPPLSRSITILISRRRARVSERMRTRKRWARERREKGEAGSRCGPFTREWGKRKIEINRLHETHTYTHVCLCACIIWEIANRTRQWSRLRRSEGIATATTDPNSPELRFTLTAWGPTARLKTSRGIFVNYARQSSFTHTHTHTCIFLATEFVGCMGKSTKKSLSLLSLIEWTCPKMNWWQQRRKREGAKEKGQCIAANYSTGQGDRQQRKLIFADLDLPVRIWMLWHVKHTAPIT